MHLFRTPSICWTDHSSVRSQISPWATWAVKAGPQRTGRNCGKMLFTFHLAVSESSNAPITADMILNVLLPLPLASPVVSKARELHTLHSLRKLFVQDLSIRVRKVSCTFPTPGSAISTVFMGKIFSAVLLTERRDGARWQRRVYHPETKDFLSWKQPGAAHEGSQAGSNTEGFISKLLAEEDCGGRKLSLLDV